MGQRDVPVQDGTPLVHPPRRKLCRDHLTRACSVTLTLGLRSFRASRQLCLLVSRPATLLAISGSVLSAMLTEHNHVGSFAGAIVNSWLADKIGRKKCVSVHASRRCELHLLTSSVAPLCRSCVSFSPCSEFRCTNGSAHLTASTDPVRLDLGDRVYHHGRGSRCPYADCRTCCRRLRCECLAFPVSRRHPTDESRVLP